MKVVDRLWISRQFFKKRHHKFTCKALVATFKR